jgi:plasmid stabilization system protein ParE
MVNMFKVIFGKKARQDLQEISSYHRKTASPQVAKNVRKGIIDSAKKLQTFPHRKPILAGTEDRSSPVRYTKKWSFKILFSIFEDKKQVEVLRIKHDKELPEKTVKSIK